MALGSAVPQQDNARVFNLFKSPNIHDWVGSQENPLNPHPNQFGELLARCLDIGDLLETFFNHLSPVLVHDGFNYHHPALALDHSCGDHARHHLEYRLVLGEEDLGALRIYRRRPFTAQEIGDFEAALCSLIYPLRNATLYQSALKSAYRDPLTGVDNRAALEQRLPREIQMALRYATPTALMVLDVDCFKQINDTYGHRVGDNVLQRFVSIFEDVLRTTDLVYRYGGDEFVILLSNTGAEGAAHVAERLREKAEHCVIMADGVQLHLTASIGITQLVTNDTPESVFSRADQALLFAKRAGRNRVVNV